MTPEVKQIVQGVGQRVEAELRRLCKLPDGEIPFEVGGINWGDLHVAEAALIEAVSLEGDAGVTSTKILVTVEEAASASLEAYLQRIVDPIAHDVGIFIEIITEW